MKKFLKVIAILFIVVAVVTTFAACNKYKYSAVGTMEYANQNAIGNGSLSVQQGNYLYFVNGADSNTSATKAKELDWNSKSEVYKKGGILKAEIKEDGSLNVLGYVVPKMFFSSYSQTGLYVYGSWIYYVTPTQKTDNKGNLLSGVVYMRTSLDGKKTQTIADIEGFDNAYVFTPYGLLYVLNTSEIHFVSYSDKKVGKDQVVEEKATGILLNKQEGCIFYITSEENDYIFGNNICVITNSGEKKVVISTSAYTSSKPYYTDIEKQFAISLLSYDADSRTLVYTKTSKSAQAKAQTCAYKFAAEGYEVNIANEIYIANSALSFLQYYDGVGYINISSETLKIYSAKDSVDADEVISKDIKFSSSISIFKIDGQNLYYGLNSKFYKANLFNEDKTLNENAIETCISDAVYSTTMCAPVMIGNYIYFINSNQSSYLYRLDYTSYIEAPNNIKKAKEFIVSGYRTYDYEKEDSKYEDDYIIHKDDEDLENKVPAYITEADLKTYITNNKKDKK